MDEISGGTTGGDESGALNNFPRGGVVTARGTGDGLVLRLDGRVEARSLRDALAEFLQVRRGFLANNEVVLEWVGEIPNDQLVKEISGELARDFNITVRASRLREQVKVSTVEASADEPSTPNKVPVAGFSAGSYAGNKNETSASKSGSSKRTPSLFDGVEAMGWDPETEGAEPAQKGRMNTDPALWDDPDTRIVYTTLRSGQKIESEHSVVICGDVNSGGEIIAGGDIIVLGTLRGVAHAGAYDETGGGRFIFALSLQPTQLRIGTVISRGSSESRQLPEIARVDGNLIVVEPYQAKNFAARKA